MNVRFKIGSRLGTLDVFGTFAPHEGFTPTATFCGIWKLTDAQVAALENDPAFTLKRHDAARYAFECLLG